MREWKEGKKGGKECDVINRKEKSNRKERKKGRKEKKREKNMELWERNEK